MPIGIVKWFSVAKRYGFIAPEHGGGDVFVHTSAVQEAGFNSLDNGQVVEYEMGSNKGRPCAIALTLLDREYLDDPDYDHDDPDYDYNEEPYSAEDSSQIEGRHDYLVPQGNSRNIQMAPARALRQSPDERENERRRLEQRRQNIERENERHRLEQQRQNILRMKRWFTDVSEELNTLRPLIFQKQGIFLKRHVYSVDDLLNHRVFHKIKAMCGVIEDHFDRWQRNGSADYPLMVAYEDERRRIIDEISGLTKEITSRKPTHWEVIRDALVTIASRFIARIAETKLLSFRG